MTIIEQFRESIPHTTSQGKAKFCLKFIKSNPNSLVIFEAKRILKTDDMLLVRKLLTGEIKTCPICGQYFYNRHAVTCSKECRAEQIRNTLKQTNLEKYGVEWYTATKDFKDKVKNTVMQRYGVTCVSKLSSVKEKYKETCKKKYGVEYYYQTKEFKEKAKKTCVARYGVEHSTQSLNAKKKVKETVLKKYGVHAITQSEVFKEKAKQTCIKKYGADNYAKTKQFKKTLKKNNKETLLKDLKNINVLHLEDLNENFLNTFVFEVDNTKYFDLNKCEDYFGITYPIIKRIKCAFDIELPNYYERETKDRSNAEIDLFNWIPCSNKISNNRKIIYPLELDMVLPDYKLAIEYDGVYWHSDEYKDQNYHLNKTLECNNKGIQLFHIFDTDDIDIWKSMISNKLKLNTKVYARKCLVKEITNSDAKSFCAQNHLQGACNAKINLGLFYNDELLEVMTFGKPRYNKHYEYELLRLCTKKYYSVIGGASKLWKCFCQKYSPKSVISYANRRFSNGNIYETLGFKFLNETKPNYWYVKGGELFSRLKFQKHKLKDILENYDENLSEYENMQLNNYHRIFDCGNLVYTINF